MGYLIGRPNRGLAMFHMMNEARIGAGLGATALGYTGYLKSLRYAGNAPRAATSLRRIRKTRKSRSPNTPTGSACCSPRRATWRARSASSRPLLSLVDDEMTAPDEDDRTRAGLLLEILTPIAKSWPSQWCLEANSLAIQVHGGYGYAREYDVEQHYRDNRLNPIHEGTHGIQALDLLGRR